MRELTRTLNSHIGGFLCEVAGIAFSRKRLPQLLRVPLYTNAIYQMAANISSALCGVAFWVIATRFYDANDVGRASAVIAAMGLLASLANLGLGFGLIRFLPGSREKAGSLLNSSFTISVLTSLLVSLVFLVGLDFWSPALLFLRQEALFMPVFVFFTIAFTLRLVGGEALIAKRRASLLLMREIIFNVLRLPLVVLLALGFGSLGIFGSWGIAVWVAVLFNLLVFLPRVQPGYSPRVSIDREVRGMLLFASGNYVSNILRGAPSMILPIMVINLSGAEDNAYFYIAWMIGSTLNMVAESTSISLFTEGSHDEGSLGLNVKRSVKMILVLLVPVVVLVVALADKLLLAFGGSYSETGTTLLRILAVSAFPIAINTVYINIKRVQKRLITLIEVGAFLAVSTLAMSYVLLPSMGITGVGIAWLTSQGILALVIVAGFVNKALGPSSSSAIR